MVEYSVIFSPVIINRTLMNVSSNFIPNKLVTFNDKDPPWMTSNVRDKKTGKIVFIRII